MDHTHDWSPDDRAAGAGIYTCACGAVGRRLLRAERIGKTDYPGGVIVPFTVEWQRRYERNRAIDEYNDREAQRWRDRQSRVDS